MGRERRDPWSVVELVRTSFSLQGDFQVKGLGQPSQREQCGVSQSAFDSTDFSLGYVRLCGQVSLAYSQLLPAVGKALSDAEALEPGLTEVIAGSTFEGTDRWRVASAQLRSQLSVCSQLHDFP